MALIKCKECNKEISDTAKVCPHCGYIMKTKKSIIGAKLNSNNISNIEIITIACMICILILSFVNGTYTIKWSEGYSVYASHNYDIKNLATDRFIGAFFTFIIFIIGISCIIKILNQFNLLEKIKQINNKVFYISSFIYSVILIYILLYVKTIGVKNGGNIYPAFGAYWISCIALISIGFNIANFIKNFKIKNKNIENKE